MSKKSNRGRKTKNQINYSEGIKNPYQACVRIVEVLATKGKIFSGSLMVVTIGFSMRLGEEDLGFVAKELLRMLETYYLWGYVLFFCSVASSGHMMYKQRSSYHKRMKAVVKERSKLQSELAKLKDKKKLIESSEIE